MERLNALDAEFLHLEGGIVHMHIAGIAVLGNPAPPFRDLETLITSKLHVIPRYHQRIRSVPFELGRPVWVDDPHFDLGYHLRHTALPAPGDDGAFCRLVGRIMSQPRGALKVLDAWGGLASDTLAIARDVPGSVTRPGGHAPLRPRDRAGRGPQREHLVLRDGRFCDHARPRAARDSHCNGHRRSQGPRSRATRPAPFRPSAREESRMNQKERNVSGKLG